MKKFSTALKRLSAILVGCTLFFILALAFPKSSSATCNLYQSMTTTTKDVVWSSVCTIAGGTIDGIDKAASEEDSTNTAVLTINPGGAITINATGTLVTGSLSFSGGYVAIQETGSMKIGTGIWIPDTDSDGYAVFTTIYDATASGRRRMSLMKDFMASDCNDSDANTMGASTWYQDFDSDTYGNPNVTTSACSQPGGYVSNSDDCYDSNANAKPGQTTCYTSNRGDGSFDYNCDSSQSNCNSCNTDSSSQGSLPKRQCVSDYCYTDPYDTYFTGYSCSGSTSTCGAGGVSCTGSQAAGCNYNPCWLYDYWSTGTTGCTVSCK
jgi:hypothetical protein